MLTESITVGAAAKYSLLKTGLVLVGKLTELQFNIKY